MIKWKSLNKTGGQEDPIEFKCKKLKPNKKSRKEKTKNTLIGAI